MQTKLAFLFVLHVIGLGLFLARRGAQLSGRNIIFLVGYLFVFYAAWGTAMNSMPSIFVPTEPGDVGGEGAAP